MNESDLAWLAGLIEGEGYLGIVHGRGVIRVAMTDADVVERLRLISGVGVVNELARRADHHKVVTTWTVQRDASVSGLLLAVTPLLAARRRLRASEILVLHDLETPPALPLAPGSDEAWAWVAALLEGEGYLQPSPSAKRQDKPSVSVDSTDLDVVERLREFTGVGTIATHPRQNARWKDIHRWRVSKRIDIRVVLSRVLPALGERRAERASYIISDVLRGESEIRTRGRSRAA